MNIYANRDEICTIFLFTSYKKYSNIEYWKTYIRKEDTMTDNSYNIRIMRDEDYPQVHKLWKQISGFAMRTLDERYMRIGLSRKSPKLYR